ncbi:hypothetical protein KA005_08465, partial [bacterium]|nr:hypothetical protein [bacterium]
MKKQWNILVVCLVVFLLGMSITSHAQRKYTGYSLVKTRISKPMVRIEPETQIVSPGRSFSIDIVVDPGRNQIEECSLNLLFDQTAFQVEEAELGDFLGESPKVSKGYPKISNKKGVVNLKAL